MQSKTGKALTLRDFLMLTVGTVILSIGVYFFKFTNHFTTGGVSGISIIFAQFSHILSTATVNLILNILLLLCGYLIIGSKFSLRTAYSAVLSSLLTVLFEKICPLSAPLTDQPFLELIFAVGLPALGTAMLFSADASSGGTDILAMILKKYTRLDIGIALVCVDCIAAIASCFVFNIKTGLFSILGLLLKAFLVDQVMENLRSYKVFQIVTDNPEPICTFIMEKLHHSATISDVEGAYQHTQKKNLMTVVNRSQAYKLQQFAYSMDPHCFMTITTTSQIIGKGFRGMSE